MKKLFIIVALITCSVMAFAQNRFSLEGRILNSGDSTAVEMAAIQIKGVNLWAVTNEKGHFILNGIPAGSYTFQISSLGYEPKELDLELTENRKGFDIYMNQMTLAIEEVIVVAKEGKRLGTSSLMEQTALQHVQPTDLSDIMQLLPGQVTINPDLSSPKKLTIREIDGTYDNMAGLGTLLVIDGAPVSNDANLQYTNRTGTASFATTVGTGADTRQISVDNIESVEVIRGIASVENGDLLSGAVKVNLKKGTTPFTLKVKVDPGIKQFYAGKGFMLPKDIGSLNADFDFTQSLDDIREKYKTYSRLNGGLAYSGTFFKEKKPLNLNVSLRGSQTIDLYQDDPDMLNFEKFESKDQSIALTTSGKWALNLPFISNLNFNISGNLQHQTGHEVDLESLNGPMPQPISRIAGEFETDYLPSLYTSDLLIDGKPYYLNTKLTGTKIFYVGKILNNFMIGTDFRFYGNNGLGRIYDSSRPPNPTSSSDARPRSYKEIPSMSELAYYVEENISAPIGSTKLDIQAGVRFSSIQPDGIFSSRVGTTMLDPRINIRYSIIDDRDNRNFSSLALRFGWGVFSKSPTLLHYYPDKAYFDRVSFNYYDPPNSLLVQTTKVYEDTRNYDLKPATNSKFDGGIDFKVRGIDISLTAFYEKMINGFSYERYYDTNIYNLYEPLSAGGMNPYYLQNDGVYYNDPVSGTPVKVPSAPDTLFLSYSYPGNNDQTVKKGLEFTINFGTLKKLRTSFVLDGAYLNIRKQKVNDYLEQSSLTYLGKPFPLVGLYPGGEGTNNKRLNSNLRTITHIKELRMVVTLTTQVIWFEKYQSIYNDKNGNPVVYTKVPVDDIYSDKEQIKYLDAIGFYDMNLVYHDFDAATATTKPFSDLIQTYNLPWHFIEKTYPPVFQFNLRLTKEISNKIDFSFYANNLTNYQPLTRIRGLKESYVRRNQPIYFGAELRIKI
jgi:hypothetical protein